VSVPPRKEIVDNRPNGLTFTSIAREKPHSSETHGQERDRRGTD
jgi:hypothetical protein